LSNGLGVKPEKRNFVVRVGRRVWGIPVVTGKLVGFYVPGGIWSVPLLVWFLDQVSFLLEVDFYPLSSCRGSGNSIAIWEKVKDLEDMR